MNMNAEYYLGSLNSAYSNILFLKPDLTHLELILTLLQISVYIYLQNLGNSFVCTGLSHGPYFVPYYLALLEIKPSYIFRGDEL